MDEPKPAVNTPEPAAARADVIAADDNEARLATLETEKAKVEEERDNWKTAALKYKAKAKEGNLEDGEDDARIRAIAQEALASSRLAEIAREQDSLLRITIKENKELKLARLNKTEPPAAIGSHSESVPVRDTLVTPDQMQYFKSKGWTDKDIERYKKNLAKRM